MNRSFFLTLAALCISSLTMAGHADLFSYDKDQLRAEMSDLQEAEDYLIAHKNLNFMGLNELKPELVQQLGLDACSLGGFSMLSGERLWKIPSYFWGCCLGPVGVIVVYIVADDSAETKKSFMGFITWGVTLTVYYFVAALTLY